MNIQWPGVMTETGLARRPGPNYAIPVEVLVLRSAAMQTQVTTKGQVTIPKPIRDRLGIVPEGHCRIRARAGRPHLVWSRWAEPAPSAGSKRCAGAQALD